MDALLFFLTWAVAIFLMLRLGSGAHVLGQGSSGAGGGARDRDGRSAEGLRWVPPLKDVDPVCGKTISTDGAKPSVHDGSVYYFCSRECREVFEAAPELYVGGRAEGAARQLEHHHV